MAIRAVVFDIGGVLEYNPRTGWGAKWEQKLNLKPGELPETLVHLWQAGRIGTKTLVKIKKHVRELLSFDQPQLDDFMAEVWRKYVGPLNPKMPRFSAVLHNH